MANQVVKYDALIIGSGQGGNPLSQALAQKGERVALIESGPLGGTCVNNGCTPTKTMVASAQVAHYVRNAAQWGVLTNGISMDMGVVLKRKDQVVERSRSGWEKNVDKPGTPKLYRGRARFTGPKQISVNGEVLEAERIFINTGGKATVPPLAGLESVPYLTNESIIELPLVPEHLIVLGAGYIGIEFAQMFRRFGGKVTVIGTGEQILAREDEDVSTVLQKSLEEEGIGFHLESRATRVAANGDKITVSVESKGKTETNITGSHLLVAIGRTPQTKDLALEKAGVKVDDKGYVVVNDRLETSAPDIWAIGDVKGGPAFTHISYNDYQIIYGNLYEGKNLSTKTRIVPYAVFTDPPLGRVGMTEKEARQHSKKLKIGKIEMTHVARALERGETAGIMKILVDAETDKVLGAAILSSDGDEVVQILSTLMWADKPYTLLKGAIYIHPTIAEGFFALMDSVKIAD